MTEHDAYGIINTIELGFIRGRESNFSHQKWDIQVLMTCIITISPDVSLEKEPKSKIIFFNKNVVGILLHNNDPMVS